jgi:hypothetical protein|tara:strand:- start:2130 stop:2768 length:639 start_codon:yes stop_codon:yes gene_type:complete
MWDFLDNCVLNSKEFWLVIRLYLIAAITLFLSIYHLLFTKKFSRSVFLTLLSSFLLAIFGWELWLTYGLAGGLPVDLRRSAALSCAIPINLNWVINSLGDVLVVWIGLFLVKFAYRNNDSPFAKWKWGAFFIFLSWFIIQNIYVEAFIYNLQLGSNGDLSWAPLLPLGSWFNPVLFKIAGNPITFQAQTCWLIMTPIVYCVSIFFHSKHENI